MSLVDSHAHLDHTDFSGDRSELIESFASKEIMFVVNPGSNESSSKKALDLALRYDRIFAAVGTHPHDADEYTKVSEQKYREYAKEEKVVAIGEIGLDYYYDHADREVQRDVFIQQIQLAKELDLPVIVHNRESDDDCHALLKEHMGPKKGVMHCFSEDYASAKRYLDLGMYVSLSGMVTFKRAEETAEVAKNIPLDRLLIETDSPYLTPVPNRGKRNDPTQVMYVAEKIAEIRGIPVEEVMQVTKENALRLFGIHND